MCARATQNKIVLLLFKLRLYLLLLKIHRNKKHEDSAKFRLVCELRLRPWPDYSRLIHFRFVHIPPILRSSTVQCEIPIEPSLKAALCDCLNVWTVKDIAAQRSSKEHFDRPHRSMCLVSYQVSSMVGLKAAVTAAICPLSTRTLHALAICNHRLEATK